MLKPIDTIDAKMKIMEAVSRGFMRQNEEEEYDIGLAELEQKKTAKSPAHNTSTRRRSFLGLRRKR